jgi:DNA-binding protein HU-beta
MAPVHYAPNQLNTLDRALLSGDENTLVEELRRVKRKAAPRSKRVQKVVQILKETDSTKVRNAAAVALADMHARTEAHVILELLTDAKTQSSRGTLLYALEEMGEKVPLGILMNILLTGTYEARQEALDLIGAGKTTFTEDELPAAEDKLRSSLTSLNGEQRESIQEALQMLSDLANKTDLASGATVTLKHLAANLSESHEISKKRTEEMLGDLVELVTRHLKRGDRIRISGLGIFQVRKRAARRGLNPATGEPVQIMARKLIAFRPAKDLKEAV